MRMINKNDKLKKQQGAIALCWWCSDRVPFLLQL